MELILFLVSVWIVLWLALKFYRAREREALLRAMDGLTFEHYIAWLLQHQGYSHVEVTKGSGDFGADIIATKGGLRYAIQVKRHSGRVSRDAVSDAVAAKDYYGCNAAMVITNSYLSQPALDFANSVGCEIVDRGTLAAWILQVQSASPSDAQEQLPEPVAAPPSAGALIS